MRRTTMNTLTKGLIAGVAGTTVMTALQEASLRLKQHALVGTKHEEEAEAVDPWTRAPAPAQLLQRAVTKATGVAPDPVAIPLYTNVMHWGYGIGLGVVYAVAAKKLRAKPTTAVAGAAFGMGVWAQSYATLVPLGLYRWPWHYSAKTIAKDVSYHLAYGTGTAVGYRLLTGKRRTAS
jgi:uncharacterized membrane protein YagU involved in acid resistance